MLTDVMGKTMFIEISKTFVYAMDLKLKLYVLRGRKLALAFRENPSLNELIRYVESMVF